MGTISQNINCPRCQSTECFDDYNYKTAEEYIICPDCGYQYSFKYRRDNSGNYIKKDPNGDLVYSNLITDEETIKEPYGAYCVEYLNGLKERGTIITEQGYLEFKNGILDSVDNNVVSIKVTRYADNEIKKVLEIRNANNLIIK